MNIRQKQTPNDKKDRKEKSLGIGRKNNQIFKQNHELCNFRKIGFVFNTDLNKLKDKREHITDKEEDTDCLLNN